MGITINKKLYEGGPSSGNFGHAGRPGEQGGSAPGGGGWQSRRGVEGMGTQKGRNIIAAKARQHRASNVKSASTTLMKSGQAFPARIGNYGVKSEIERRKYRMVQAQALKALRKAGFRTGTVPGSANFATSLRTSLAHGKHSEEMFKFGRPGQVGGSKLKTTTSRSWEKLRTVSNPRKGWD